ncbi:MAG: hypothetical protein WCW25_02805 [Patescibacteria group bacterium]|jgi:hypothetical protein
MPFIVALPILAIISLASLFGGLVYYFYSLNTAGIALAAVLTAFSGWKLVNRLIKNNKNHAPKNFSAIISNGHEAASRKKISWIGCLKIIIPSALYAVFFGLAIFTLFTNQTDRAIISPWQAAPAYFLVYYFLATLLILLFIVKSKKLRITNYELQIFILLHYLLSFSVALVIYKIGYGFDPFIHGAALKVIDAKGIIAPKTFYYSGFYGLIIILHKLLFIPISWINKLLVPILSALILPPVLINSFKKTGHASPLLSAVLLLAMPFSFLILTTPQNLAFLFALIIILFSLTAKNILEHLTLLLFSSAAFMIHPLAGIPLIFFSLIRFVNFFAQGGLSADKKLAKFIPYKKYLNFIFYFLSAAALPLAFYVFEKGLSAPDTAPPRGIKTILSVLAKSLKISFPNQENIFLNFSYFIAQNGLKIFLILAAAGIIYAIARSRFRELRDYFFMSAGLIFSYFLTEALSFSFLIDYERSAYSERILFLSMMFLMPFIFLLIKWYLSRLALSRGLAFYSGLVFSAALITASLYNSYPRYDAYFNSRGYSTGKYDLAAVHWIEEDAKGKFIVLANQQVSAGALREFGFSHYYQAKSGEEIFNYPIPTGGKLYQYYLSMVYDKPTRVRMSKAMNLADVQTGYFVLNKYWNNFPKVLDEAKLSADSWQSFGEGEVWVFKYKK